MNPKPSLALASSLVLLLAAGVAWARPQTPTASAAAATCSPQGKFSATTGVTVYCGPARTTVRFGGKTASFKNGTCVWGASSFNLLMGTGYLYLRPGTPRQNGFSIYASGYPTARALIAFSWAGKYYFGTTLNMTAKPSANRTGGTFQGRLGKNGSGPLATGTIRCS